MTSIQLFQGFSEINTDLLRNLEPNIQLEKEKIKNNRMPKHLLLVALIALLLMLVGCTVVYVLNLNGIRLGNQLVAQDVFDYNPDGGEAVAYVGQETQTQQVLTLAGLNGTSASQAAREWYSFCESYDPDRMIQKAAWGNEPVFPDEYRGYGLYSQAMKSKLDEILSKYKLKLRGNPVEFQTPKLLFRALGIDSILNTGSTAQMRVDYASFYENGNLDVYFNISLPNKTGTGFERTNGYLFYRPKDCFIPDTAILADVEWQEWNYTTSAGDKVLIIRSEEAGSAWIFHDMTSYTASLRLDTIRRMYEDTENGVPVAKFEVLSAEQLEQIADSINFSLEPKLVDGWENLPNNSVPAGQEINGYRIEPMSAFTDGYGYQIVLRITAPDGVTLTNPNDYTSQIEAGNGVYGHCEEDGDGKLNTCSFIISDYCEPWNYPADGSLPYPEGHIIPVYWEDLYFSSYDFEKFETIDTLLAEGSWEFSIPLNDADTREIELLSHPITAKGCVGWKMDGSDVFEDLQITSIKLRSLGLDLTSENENADFLCFTGQFAYLVMQDGSKIEVTWRMLSNPIDLKQVAYLQLADETIIPMPGVDMKTIEVISEALDSNPEEDSIPTFENGIELVSEPITLKHLAGYAGDPTGDISPLYEYFTLNSFILHSEGAVALDHRALEDPDIEITVMMEDGRTILLINSGCGRTDDGVAFSTFEAQAQIDLEKVECVIMPDGTKIPVPEN